MTIRGGAGPRDGDEPERGRPPMARRVDTGAGRSDDPAGGDGVGVRHGPPAAQHRDRRPRPVPRLPGHRGRGRPGRPRDDPAAGDPGPRRRLGRRQPRGAGAPVRGRLRARGPRRGDDRAGQHRRDRGRLHGRERRDRRGDRRPPGGRRRAARPARLPADRHREGADGPAGRRDVPPAPQPHPRPAGGHPARGEGSLARHPAPDRPPARADDRLPGGAPRRDRRPWRWTPPTSWRWSASRPRRSSPTTRGWTCRRARRSRATWRPAPTGSSPTRRPRSSSARCSTASARRSARRASRRRRTSGVPFHEVLTLASLVERETADDAERARIAGVITNRLRTPNETAGFLGLDPTIFYLNDTLQLAKMPLAKWPTYVFWAPPEGDRPRQTCRRRSPATTRTPRKGLPPGPDLHPDGRLDRRGPRPRHARAATSTSSRPRTGKTVFAKTYEEHLKNIKKYGGS